MHTFNELTRAINRPSIYVRGLQARFELPDFEGARYSDAYLALLRKLIHLRTLSISEPTLRDLWHIEKKLLQILHADSTGSPTWFLDACGATTHPERRLLLTSFDLGVEVPSGALQLGFNFADQLPELFTRKEMGEDALRVLNDYLKLFARIRSDIAAELPLVRSATQWAVRQFGKR
jgi:hypothetical protein